MEKYLVSSDDCMVLLALRDSRSLREAAKSLACDPGGLLRKVQRIADELDLVQKRQGKWTLTERGEALVAWTMESILSQRQLLEGESVVRFAAPTWFAERVLIPRVSDLPLETGRRPMVEFIVPGQGFELALMEGKCDYAVACHPPESPVIAHRQVRAERWVVVASPQFLHASGLVSRLSAGVKKREVTLTELLGLSFVRHSALNPEQFFSSEQVSATTLTVDNLAGVRAAVVNGLGWSFVPFALVAEEVRAHRLVEVRHPISMDRKVCVWWLRNSVRGRIKVSQVSAWIERACSALE